MADEYNFMSGAGGSLPMGAYQRATQLRAAAQDPYYQLNNQLKQYQLEAARLSMHERAASLQMQLRQRQGMAEFQSWLSDKDLSDPETYKGALGLAAQYGLDEQVTSPFFKRMNDALLMRERIRILEAQQRATSTAPISNFNRDSELRAAVAKAEASGDPAAVESAKADLERFRQYALSESKLGISRPLSEDAALRAVLGLTELSDMDRLLGNMPMEDKEAIRRVLSIRDRLQGAAPSSVLPQTEGGVLTYDPATDTLE